MSNALNELPTAKLEIDGMDYYWCLCGRWQPEKIRDGSIVCANCGRIAKR
jgi:hypothetical protein